LWWELANWAIIDRWFAKILYAELQFRYFNDDFSRGFSIARILTFTEGLSVADYQSDGHVKDDQVTLMSLVNPVTVVHF